MWLREGISNRGFVAASCTKLIVDTQLKETQLKETQLKHKYLQHLLKRNNMSYDLSIRPPGVSDSGEKDLFAEIEYKIILVMFSPMCDQLNYKNYCFL